MKCVKCNNAEAEKFEYFCSNCLTTLCKFIDENYHNNFEEALKQLDTNTIYFLGYYYFLRRHERNNIMKAFDLYSEAAKRGYGAALRELGMFYKNGFNPVLQNYTKAIELYTKAAENGAFDAYCNLAELYLKGHGVEKNVRKAIELYTKAIENGYPVAYYDLAQLYHKGHGVEKNHKKAIELYTKAAENGVLYAYDSLAELYYYDEINYKEAFKYYTITKDYYQLGRMYYEGQGVEKNHKKAFEMFLKGAQNENWGVQLKCLEEIGFLYYKEQDYDKAFEYYLRADSVCRENHYERDLRFIFRFSLLKWKLFWNKKNKKNI